MLVLLEVRWSPTLAHTRWDITAARSVSGPGLYSGQTSLAVALNPDRHVSAIFSNGLRSDAPRRALAISHRGHWLRCKSLKSAQSLFGSLGMALQYDSCSRRDLSCSDLGASAVVACLIKC